MKKLQRYVLKDVLKALLPAFATLALIMVVGFCMQLLHEGLDVVRLRGVLPPLLAYCVPMVLPAAFLTAVIMTFGRLSADNELIAIRAAGVHVFSIVHPVLLTALLLAGLTTYFQFELVPRSRAAIDRLKYTAFRQILLDNVALSSRRQFSFKPMHIQYDDFANGRLRNLFLLEMRGRHPRIITAGSATIQPDPQRPEIVQFQLRDCMITDLGLQEYGEAGTMTAGGMRSSVRVAPDPSEIRRDEKHLPTGKLFARLRALKRRVAQQEKFSRPSQVRREQKKKLRLLHHQLADVERNMERLQEKHDKYAVVEPEQNRELIRSNERKIEETRTQIETFQQQLLDCVQRISKLREAGSAETDYDRLVELQNQQQDFRTKIEAGETKISDLQAEIRDARDSLAQSRKRAEEVARELEEVSDHRATLLERRAEVQRVMDWAEDQHDLIAVRLRIHKRLAQAVSLFIFALVGIPLGIAAGERSVMIAFGISFGMVLLVFYPFLIVGQIASKAGALPVVPAMWAGNVFVGIIGLVLSVKVLLK